MSAVVSGRRLLGQEPAFWLLSYAFLILFVGTTIPTPLYRVYQEELHFSSGTLTLIFAIYVLFLLPSLLVFGRISDRVGRRTVLLFGFTVAALAAAIFAGAESLFSLFVARALQGIATGVVAERAPPPSRSSNLPATAARPPSRSRSPMRVARRSALCSRGCSPNSAPGRHDCPSSSTFG